MNSKKMIVLGIVGALLLLTMLMTTVAWAESQGPDPAAAPTGHNLKAPLAPASVGSDTISYQGRLLDSSGSSVDGTTMMTFSLYMNASGGMALWVKKASQSQSSS